MREQGSVSGLSRLHTAGNQHLCVDSANCARWKSAASRRISSQASAITAPLAPDTGKRQTRQPSAGRRHPGTGRSEGQETCVKEIREHKRDGRDLRPQLGVACGKRLYKVLQSPAKADSVILFARFLFLSSNHQMIFRPYWEDETHFFCRTITNGN